MVWIRAALVLGVAAVALHELRHVTGADGHASGHRPLGRQDLLQGALHPDHPIGLHGYHSFEHRWALGDAFERQARLGGDCIAARVEALSSRLRDGLAEILDVRVHAPPNASCAPASSPFSVGDRDPQQVVDDVFQTHRVQATVTPYAVPLARMGTCWLNTEEEVDAAIDAVRVR